MSNRHKTILHEDVTRLIPAVLSNKLPDMRELTSSSRFRVERKWTHLPQALKTQPFTLTCLRFLFRPPVSETMFLLRVNVERRVSVILELMAIEMVG